MLFLGVRTNLGASCLKKCKVCSVLRIYCFTKKNLFFFFECFPWAKCSSRCWELVTNKTGPADMEPTFQGNETGRSIMYLKRGECPTEDDLGWSLGFQGVAAGVGSCWREDA